MPHSISAKKRQRQNETRRIRNRAARSAIKTLVRKIREAVVEGDLETAAAGFQTICKKIDQTASKGIVHRNMAARVKSRLSAALKAAKTKQTA